MKQASPRQHFRRILLAELIPSGSERLFEAPSRNRIRPRRTGDEQVHTEP